MIAVPVPSLEKGGEQLVYTKFITVFLFFIVAYFWLCIEKKNGH